MSEIVVDDNMRDKLSNVRDASKVCDSLGRVLGTFVPIDPYERQVLDWARATVTDEELERSRNEPGGSTLAEIKKRLGWE